MKPFRVSCLLVLLAVSANAHAYLESSWTRFFNGVASKYDAATDIAYSPDGYLYVTAIEADSNGPGHIAVIKYSTGGVFQWLDTHANTFGQWDYAWAVAADSDGNAYVAGQTYVLGGSAGFLTRYNPGGGVGWQKITQILAGYGWQAILYNGQGSIFVAGASSNPSTIGLSVAKYSTAGDSIWARDIPVPADVILPEYSDPRNQYLALDPLGNILVACEIGDVGTRDVFLAKLSPTGDTIWTRRYDSPGNHDETVRGLAVDNAGNPIVGGSSHISGTDWDYIAVKYLANGTKSWEKRLDGGTTRNDECSGLAMDPSGAAFLTGYSFGANGFPGVLTVKYSADGDSLWADHYGTSFQYNYGSRIITDATGDAYMIGTGYIGTEDKDILLIHYNGTNGIRSDILTVGGPVSGGDGGTAIVADGSGNFYAAGYAWYSDAHQQDVAVVQFQNIPSAVTELGGARPQSPNLAQNYPNPFNAATQIRFAVPAFRHVTLVIYDMLGRAVRHLVDQDLAPGTKSVEWDAKDELGHPVASGVYVYRLTIGDFSEARTMVLMK